jgi:predicted DNA-binding protein (MmcQ/YjbR family)
MAKAKGTTQAGGGAAGSQLEVPLYAKVRALCLSLPNTTEASAWGHPNFRTKKRMYVALESHEGRPTVAMRLGADHVNELCADGKFFPTRYGKGLWASTYADQRLSWIQLMRLIKQAHELSLAN